MRTAITNARIVLADQILEDACLLIEDGSIAAIVPEAPPAAAVIDLGGDLLLPGLIDIHCDALEKDVEPRPGVHFPLPLAVASADRRNACCGITTSFHAIAFAHGELGVRNTAVAATLVQTLHAARPHTLIDNRVHARYEVTDAHSAAMIHDLLAAGQLDALSFMDHTPGQGQFKSLEAYQQYLERSYQLSAAEADALIAGKRVQGAAAFERVASLAAAARQQQVPLISHDDDSPARVAQMAEFGVQVSEFPVTLAAAQAARSAQVATAFGTPNLLRGQSQSGSMRAIDALQAGVATCLCADYAPASMLPAVFCLPALAGWSLPQAVNLVSRNPAQALGLTDRGELAVGKRADCIAVRQAGVYPQVVAVWAGGRLVLRMG